MIPNCPKCKAQDDVVSADVLARPDYFWCQNCDVSFTGKQAPTACPDCQSEMIEHSGGILVCIVCRDKTVGDMKKMRYQQGYEAYDSRIKDRSVLNPYCDSDKGRDWLDGWEAASLDTQREKSKQAIAPQRPAPTPHTEIAPGTLYAFWHYDAFPYWVGGEITKMRDDGSVYAPSFQGWWKNAVIVTATRRKELKTQLDLLALERRTAERDFAKTWREKLNMLTAGTLPPKEK